MSGSKAHMLNFSLICLVILNMIHSIICPHSRWKQEFVFCFFVETCWEKKGKKAKIVPWWLFWLISFGNSSSLFFFVMICKIDLNINLVKMALIIFISDEAIFCFWRTVIMTREFTLLSKIWNLAFCDFHVSYFFLSQNISFNKFSRVF